MIITVHPVTQANIDQLAARIEQALEKDIKVHIALEVAHDELWEINEGDVVIFDES